MDQAVNYTVDEPSTAKRRWDARLSLKFAASDHATRLVHSEHQGPLRVQRLFYPDQGGKAHCYLLHPPGGVVLGDQLRINVDVNSGAALVTTPSAGRFYGVGNHKELQKQSVTLRAKDGALEWLPQETIFFQGANAQLTTDIHVEDGADLVFWDVLVFGRPACGERFTHGKVSQALRLYQKERLVIEERMAFTAGDRFCKSRMGLNGASTVGVMLATAKASRELLDAWLESVNIDRRTDSRESVEEAESPFTVSQRAQILIARYLGEDAMRCRDGFAKLWRALREQSTGKRPAIPRIWNT